MAVTVPPEWAPHRACWLAFPHLDAEWAGELAGAQAELAALCRAIADPDPQTGTPRGERVELLVVSEDVERVARSYLGDLVRYHRLPYGDCWTRDTAPVFVRSTETGALAAACFGFNGWGGKYRMPGDERVARAVADTLHVPARDIDLVAEGGALEVDGEGTLLTTRACLVDPLRNPGVERASIERALAAGLGAERVLWLEGTLQNDHTDGHIDTLARFVEPGVVLAMEPAPGDPNEDALRSIRRQLEDLVDARGRRLDVRTIPSPGRVDGPDGSLLPASYCNYYLSNRHVLVPTYGVAADDEAVERIGALFPSREAKGLAAYHLLTGGGAFHCVTQQEPEAAPRKR